MKEATGELNMTVVTVVAIAAVGAFFYAFVWPSIHDSIIASTNCASAQCSECTYDSDKTVCTKCMYGATFDKGPITCQFKGSNGSSSTATGTSGTATP